MKKLILAFFLSFLGHSAYSQVWTGVGDQKLQLGFNAYGYGTGISGSYDFGFADMASVGGGADFYFGNDNDDGDYFIYGRVNLHLSHFFRVMPPELDIYPGMKLGVLSDAFGWSLHLGARYSISPTINIYGEFGKTGSLGVGFTF